MTYQESCRHLKQLLERLQRVAVSIFVDGLDEEMRQLRQDIDADFFTIVVLGEFKRGKSTLVNALVGENILPVDVTPTTATINVLLYNDDRRLTIHRPDGTTDCRDLNVDTLSEFVVGGVFDAESVEYLEIGLPAPLLRDRVILVDTPGVSDLNQQRADITYRFIPRADAVLFMLDATSPVRKSEKEFFETSVLRNGLDRIAFVANFADMLDAEDVSQVTEMIRRRVASALSLPDPPVYVVSARQALEQNTSNGGRPHADGGMSELAEWFRGNQEDGLRSRAKTSRFLCRLSAILGRAENEAAKTNRALQLSDGELRKALETLGQFTANGEQRRARISDWTQDRRNEIRAIVSKSLDYFSRELKEELIDLVDSFKGSDFKEFVQGRVPVHVKRRCKGWVESHAEPISVLLRQFDHELSAGLSREFEAAVTVGTEQAAAELGRVQALQITADDVSSSGLVAGLITGGAAALLMVLGGPVFLPIVSMAGFPFLQKAILEKNLADAKAKLTPQLRSALNRTLTDFEDNVLAAVDHDIDAIYKAADARFEELLAQEQRRVESEIRARRQDQADLVARSEAVISISEQLAVIRSDMQELSEIVSQ